MKKSFYLLAMLAGLFFFVSCDKDNGDDGNNNGNNNNNNSNTEYIRAKVNGEDFSARVATGVVDGGLGAKVSISSLSFNNAPIMMISFPEGTAVGTYQISGGFFGDFSARYDMVLAISGTITITSFDEVKNIVKGTFAFIAEGYTITDGEFAAEIP